MAQVVLSEQSSLWQSPSRVDVLSIPMPDEPFVECAACNKGVHPSIVIEDRTHLPRHLRASSVDAKIAFYRWMLGHHVAICSWRMLGDALAAASRDPVQSAERLDESAFFLDVYSLMLVYAGSCTAEVYASAIRPHMMQVSPSFSGTWARDYERVHNLMRWVPHRSHRAFTLAYRNVGVIHMFQAKRLVPDGVSLLRAAGRSTVRATELERDLFDRFFLTDRQAGCHWNFRAQLAQRLSQIFCDLKMRPLSTADYSGPALRTAMSCEIILRQLAAVVIRGHQ